MEEPEAFFRRQGKALVVLDEVHRLQNPSEVLKIAADHFPGVQLVATGSSTLAAKNKFKDTLTGRKREVWLTPMILDDLQDLGDTNLDRRMLHGGLPPMFLADTVDDYVYEEWMDSFWAKDLTELFVIEKKAAFFKFVELLFAQSGSLFEAQSFAAPCEISRPTVQQYLSILETTLVAAVVRPYHAGAAAEIRSQPKVYAFDTGFVSYFKGIDRLRDDDRGMLLEHLVLNELLARYGAAHVYHWRDKQQHEVDFVLQAGRAKQPLAIECKASASKFNPAGMQAFRRRHPAGDNIVVTLRETERFEKTFGGVGVSFVPLTALPGALPARGVSARL